MAEQDQELVAGQRVGNIFRTAAGLPERESDEPITSAAEVSELRIAREPEGGYGNRGEEETEEEVVDEDTEPEDTEPETDEDTESEPVDPEAELEDEEK